MNETNENKIDQTDQIDQNIKKNILESYLEKNYNFKNPIEYNSKTRIIDENIIKTLELVDSIDNNEI